MADLRVGNFSFGEGGGGFDKAGALAAGTGDRVSTARLTFSSPFPSSGNIQVLVSLNMLDLETGETVGGVRNIRVQTFVSGVDQKGFSLSVRTWGSSAVWGLHGHYLAVQ